MTSADTPPELTDKEFNCVPLNIPRVVLRPWIDIQASESRSRTNSALTLRRPLRSAFNTDSVAAYPFSAPPPKPRTRYFCTKNEANVTGKMAKMMAADICPISTPLKVQKPAMPTGSVELCLPVSSKA